MSDPRAAGASQSWKTFATGDADANVCGPASGVSWTFEKPKPQFGRRERGAKTSAMAVNGEVLFFGTSGFSVPSRSMLR